jgi:hypothetical protein
VILGDELDLADDVRIERRQVLGRDPVLKDGLTACLAYLVMVEEGLTDLEAGHVARARRRHVPVPSDLGGVLLI